jgi:predicted ATPase
VLAHLAKEKPEIKARIQSYLGKIVPDVTEIHRVPVGSWETIEFRQGVIGAQHPWKFYAASMADGTLRALGALVAVTQLAERDMTASVVGLEEPETALHVAAAGALMDALREATCHTQVLVTTHSPDLLDQLQLDTDTLLAVQARQGNTELGSVDPASQEAIKSHLYTAGELLRMDQLEIDPRSLERQGELFATEEVAP